MKVRYILLFKKMVPDEFELISQMIADLFLLLNLPWIYFFFKIVFKIFMMTMGAF